MAIKWYKFVGRLKELKKVGQEFSVVIYIKYIWGGWEVWRYTRKYRLEGIYIYIYM